MPTIFRFWIFDRDLHNYDSYFLIHRDRFLSDFSRFWSSLIVLIIFPWLPIRFDFKIWCLEEVFTKNSFSWTFWEKIHQRIHESVDGYGWCLRDHFLSDFDDSWLFFDCSDDFLVFLASLDEFEWMPSDFEMSIDFFDDFIHVQTQNNHVRKWSYLMNLVHRLILIHRTHFLSDSVARGLDLRLRDLIRSFAIMKCRILSQKIILIDDLRVEDHARVLYFWGHGGTLRTKMSLKWSLEALIVTRNTRIARGRSRSQM